jgi:tagatose 1,6-diphosphate aldolase GatY/KbaY
MQYVPSADLVGRALSEGYAVPAFCVWNLELALTALRVAERMRAPVLLMNGPSEFAVLDPAGQARAARAAAEDFDVPAALHLDHGESLDHVRACLDAGYTSVMLDCSDEPYDRNVAALRAAVELSRAVNVTVEGEIGAVGKVDDATSEGARASTLTDPQEARRYVCDTGVDMLAVSIGNAHGVATRLPRLDFERLERIRRAVDVPLVLHGGSGTSPADIRRAISHGIAKINVASEICNAYRSALMDAWTAGPAWVPTTLAQALPAIEQVMAKWVAVTGAGGRA